MAVLRPAGDFDRSYEQDMSILRSKWQWALLILSLAVLYYLPQLGNPYITATLNQIAYTIITLQGLSLLTGYTGQISLGQAAFMLVGGYAAGLSSIHWGLPFFLAIPFAGLMTGLVGLVFGLPSLRVKGFYLAMATLAAQFIIPWLSRQPFLGDYFGGTEGFIKIPDVELFGFNFGELSAFVYISLTVLIITTILTMNVTRTRMGRALVSIRDNDLAAELLGVNLFRYKLRAFFLAAFFAGVAGSLRAFSQHGIGTELGYGLDESILFLGMLVIGGLGTNLGPYLGAIFVILLEDLSLETGAYLAETFPDLAAQLLSSFRPIMFGLVLVVFLIFMPRGLAHWWMLIKSSWRLRPFAR
ncbi:MAG: branched-chain amino acid ABC transporter permease [Chloroflexi bacterium]|nr:branched-chain amino acid ABC transporter permease [Chloroflexota bacterium]